MLREYRELPPAVHLLCFGMFINRAGTLVVPFLALYLSKSLGFSSGFATFTIGAYGAGSLVASLIGGALADRLGRKRVMLFALVGGASVLAVFPTFQSEFSVLMGIVLFALIADMYRPAGSAALSDLVPSERRPRAFSLMYVAINLGFTVGAILGGWFAEISFDLLFYIDAGTCLAFALLILFGLRETMSPPADEAQNPSGPSRTRDRRLAFSDVLQNRTFLAFCLSGVTLACVFNQGLATLPLAWAAEGIGPKTYGRIVAVNGVLIVVFQLPLTNLVARFDRGLVMAGGAFLTALGFGLTGLHSGPLFYVFTVVVWTLGEMMQAAYGSPIVSDLAPPQFRATYFGIYGTCFSAGMMIGPPLGGLVLEAHGSGALWLGCFGLGSISGLILLGLRSRVQRPSAIPA